MTIQEYVEKNGISIRAFAMKIGISSTYLADLINKRRTHISEELANRIKEVAPEVGIIKETKIVYKVEV